MLLENPLDDDLKDAVLPAFEDRGSHSLDTVLMIQLIRDLRKLYSLVDGIDSTILERGPCR